MKATMTFLHLVVNFLDIYDFCFYCVLYQIIFMVILEHIKFYSNMALMKVLIMKSIWNL